MKLVQKKQLESLIVERDSLKKHVLQCAYSHDTVGVQRFQEELNLVREEIAKLRKLKTS